MRLLLVRHGDAFAGFGGVIAGRTGCLGLTDLGRVQAQALHDHLQATQRVQADVLLASELPRAIQTAQIIAPALGFDDDVERSCDLCEIHTGDADGLAWTEYADRFGSFDMEAEPDRVFAPNAESWNSFHDRVAQLLARIAKEYEGQYVVAVCHGGVIMASLRILLGAPLTGISTQLRPTNTGLTEWEHDETLDRWTLHSFNEATHLIGVEAPRP